MLRDFPYRHCQTRSGNLYIIMTLRDCPIPGNIPGEMAHNGICSIIIGIADTGNYETLKEQIGSRPVITIQIDVNGNAITLSNQMLLSARRTIRSTVEEAADFEHIVVWHIDAEGNAKPVETGYIIISKKS